MGSRWIRNHHVATVGNGMIEFRVGDLFEADDLDAIGQGCNCHGLMGAGFAGQIAKRYPEMVAHYQVLCHGKLAHPGTVYVWDRDDPPTIYNMFTQIRGGPNAQYGYITLALDRTLTDMKQRELLTLGIPRIGSGIGGLDVKTCEAIFRMLATAPKYNALKVVVFDLETKEKT